MQQGRSGRGLIVPIILIALGAIFLAQNSGILPDHLLREAWPLVLIAVGAILLVRRQAWRRANRRGPGQ